MSETASARVKCPECDMGLDFEITGDAMLVVGPDTLTVRYVPIVIEHKCPVVQKRLRKELEPWLIIPVERANAADWETAEQRRVEMNGKVPNV